MNTTGRIDFTRLGRHRGLIITAVVILLVTLSIPLGLKALQAGTTDLAPSSGVAVSPGMPQDAGSDTGSVAPAPAAPDSSAGGAAREAAPPGVKTGAQAAPVIDGPKLAKTAWLGIKVKDLVGASARVRSIAAAAGGQVISENVVTAPNPNGAGAGALGRPDEFPVPPVGVNEARITVSVPADKLDAVLGELSAASLGTVAYRSSQSADVTATYVDTEARIQPAKDSIARVRALMIKATTLDQIVLLESELSRRQSDLDSLQQQLADLDRRTTMSEVSVTLWTDEAATTEPDDGGVLAAFQKAWQALLDSLIVVLTGLAVLLPWLLIALVVAWFVRRWLRGRRRGAPASAD